jgi:hypothetical protein
MPEADGIIERTSQTNGRAGLVVFAHGAVQKRLLPAGCDLAGGLLSGTVERLTSCLRDGRKGW